VYIYFYRLYSQIRKGAPLHDEWRDAFAQGRFHQRQGRATLKDARQAGATHAAVSDQEPIFNVQVTSNAKPAKQSRASTRRSASNVSLASSMTYWLDPTFSEEGPEKDTLNLFNNAADVMGTHANGVACSPFDGFAEVGASLDSYLLGHPPSEKKRGAPDGVTDDRAAQQPRVELELQPPSDDLFDIALGAFA